MPRLLRQRRPTYVVIPSQVAGRRIETYEVVRELLELASTQIIRGDRFVDDPLLDDTPSMCRAEEYILYVIART